MASMLLPDEVAATLPLLYSQESKGESALAKVKFFCLASGWTWYATEYDPADKLFFGLVKGFDIELGYFSLGELQEANAGMPVPLIERDLYWIPKSIKDIRRDIENEGRS